MINYILLNPVHVFDMHYTAQMYEREMRSTVIIRKATLMDLGVHRSIPTNTHRHCLNVRNFLFVRESKMSTNLKHLNQLNYKGQNYVL